jgi:tetratricopeptide (TPR) repeat protein
VSREQAHRLVDLSEHAIEVRRFDLLHPIGAALSASGFEAGGLVLALAENRKPETQARAAAALEEILVDGSTDFFRAKAALALGVNEMERGNISAALSFYQKAQSGNHLTGFAARLMAAAALDMAGSRESARGVFSAIESPAYYIRHIYPGYFYNYLNSRALVERNPEVALKLSAIATGSPYSTAYPEWKETYADLSTKRPVGLVTGITHEPEIVPPTMAAAMCRIERVIYAPERTAFEMNACADAVETAVRN